MASYYQASLLNELSSFRLGLKDLLQFCYGLEWLIERHSLQATMFTSYNSAECRLEQEDRFPGLSAEGFDDSPMERLRAHTRYGHLEPLAIDMPAHECLLIFTAPKFTLFAVACREDQEILVKISFDHRIAEGALELFPSKAKENEILKTLSKELTGQPTESDLACRYVLRIMESDRADREVTGEARMHRLAEQSQDLIYRIQLSPKFQILYISPIVETWMGCPREELYEDARNAFAHIHPDDGLMLQEMMLTNNATEGVTLVRFIPQSGEPHWIEHRWFVDRSTDRSVVVLDGVGRDITRQKREEEAVSRALKAAEENVRSKSLFLANMSHEIRTPLNAIIGQVELLQDTPLNPEQKEMLGSVLSAGQILLSHLSDVLDFSKLDAQRVKLKPRPFSVVGAVSEALALVKDSAREKGLALLRHFGADVPAKVMGDQDKLVQMLINLLSNAVKFTERGTIEVNLDCQVTKDEVKTTILISDTGIGFPCDEFDELSRPFSQADPSSTRKRDGSGLGLAIVARLAELMEAKVSVTSEADQGSVFRVECSFEPVADQRTWVEVLEENLRPLLEKSHLTFSCSPSFQRLATVEMLLLQKFRLHSESAGTKLQLIGDPRSQQQTVVVNVPLRPEVFLRMILGGTTHDRSHAVPALPSTLRLLVVEDNDVNRKVLLRQLRKLGLSQIDFAQNGEEALAVFSPLVHDIVLMDIQMPVMDGIQTLRSMKEMHPDMSCSIVAVTAHALPGDRESYLETGFASYVSKPVRVDELRRVLMDLVKKDPDLNSESLSRESF